MSERARNVIILLLVLLLFIHFMGVPWHFTGPVGLLLVVLLVLVLTGVL
jgi:hypothetical protein